MLRIEIGEQAIVYCQGAGGRRAVHREFEHGVTAVAVPVCLLATRSASARFTVAADVQARARIRGDLAFAAAQLAPGNGAVAVVVEADGIVEVAERDVPLPLPRAGAAAQQGGYVFHDSVPSR